MANAVLATLRKMMFWFATRVDDYVPPITRGMARGEYRARERVLDDGELKTLWNACGDNPFGGLVRLALLTAQRKDKIVTMKWSDLKDGVWTDRPPSRARRAMPEP